MAIINARRPTSGQFLMTYGTSSDDIINGSDGNDFIFAGAGNDTVYGGAGNDYLNGGVGADWLYGGSGNDTLDAGALNWRSNPTGDGAVDMLVGGTGNDRYTVYESLDAIVENQNEGVDSVLAWRTGYTLGANVENLQLMTLQTDSAIGRGNELNNTLTGFWGKDSLYGMDGNDVIGDGSSFDGDDLYVGGRGSDTYRFGFFGGRDVIDNAADDSASTTDRFVWMGSSELGRLCFKQSGNDLLIDINQSGMYGSMTTQYGRLSGGPTSITVKNWYSDPSSRLDSFVNELAGKTLYEADVQRLVDAMAVYDAKQATGTATAADRTTLDSVIAAVWK